MVVYFSGIKQFNDPEQVDISVSRNGFIGVINSENDFSFLQRVRDTNSPRSRWCRANERERDAEAEAVAIPTWPNKLSVSVAAE